ncbi:S-layer protein [Synechococcus sp. 65AY6A5]|uniref:DUF4384 domain-containing protein n=1 Tax=Synechococcus sp. 65AY6A5 TaxID=1353265 RepID=UPI000C3609F5|nr:DUF4384 domain-containing protein [Synechococcus sp. 65AY6A5]PIK84702.1 S-layer protein [Synechococcus sp. 65AY6A5]
MNAKLVFLPLALGLSMAPATAVFPQTLGLYPPLQRLKLADNRLETGTRSIIVNPVPSNLQVNLELDRRGSNPIYRPGEPIAITVSTNRDAYVYLFSIQADGRTHLILPNRFSGGNEFLRAGEARTFPPPGARYRLTIAPPFGQAQVLAVASLRPLNFQEIASFEQGGSFANVRVRGSQLGDAIARAIVVEEIPATEWVTTTRFYRVAPW